MLHALGSRAELILRGVVVGGLVALTAVVVRPSPAAAGEDPCKCECIEEFGYCYECETGPDDCVFASCNGTQCRYTWGYECAEVEEPEWVDECGVD